MYCFLSTPFIGAQLLPWTSTSTSTATLDQANVGIHRQNVRITNTTHSQKCRQEAFNAAKTKLSTFTINFYFLLKMNIKCLLLSSQCTLPITGNLVFWAGVTVSTRGWQCHWHCPQASPPFISPDIRHNFKPHSESPYLFLSRDWVSGKSLISRLRLCVLVTSRKLLIYAQPC